MQLLYAYLRQGIMRLVRKWIRSSHHCLGERASRGVTGISVLSIIDPRRVLYCIYMTQSARVLPRARRRLNAGNALGSDPAGMVSLANWIYFINA